MRRWTVPEPWCKLTKNSKNNTKGRAKVSGHSTGTRILSHTHTHMCTCTYLSVYTDICICRHVYTPSHTGTHEHSAHSGTCTRAHTHAHTHTCTSNFPSKTACHLWAHLGSPCPGPTILSQDSGWWADLGQQHWVAFVGLSFMTLKALVTVAGLAKLSHVDRMGDEVAKALPPAQGTALYDSDGHRPGAFSKRSVHKVGQATYGQGCQRVCTWMPRCRWKHTALDFTPRHDVLPQVEASKKRLLNFTPLLLEVFLVSLWLKHVSQAELSWKESPNSGIWEPTSHRHLSNIWLMWPPRLLNYMCWFWGLEA